METRNGPIDTEEERQEHKEGDLSHIFASPGQVSKGSSVGNSQVAWDFPESSVSTEKSVQGLQPSKSKPSSWKFNRGVFTNEDCRQVKLEEDMDRFQVLPRSSSLDEDVVETRAPASSTRLTLDNVNETPSERRKRLEAVIGAAKERAAKSLSSPLTRGESSPKQPKTTGANENEKVERPKLTARAIRERLAASKYGSFRTRSTAGSSVSSTTSMPFSRHNEEHSQVLSRSPVTSRRLPILDGRSALGTGTQNTNFHDRSTSSSVQEKLLSADELLSKLEMNTSSKLTTLFSQWQHENEEKTETHKPWETGSSQESPLRSLELPTEESCRLNSHNGSDQNSQSGVVVDSLALNESEQTAFQLTNSNTMNVSDDLTCIFETKNSSEELEFPAFDGAAHSELVFDTSNKKPVEQTWVSDQRGPVSPQNRVFSESPEYNMGGLGYSALPVSGGRTEEFFNSSNENVALTTTSPSNVEDLSQIFQEEGCNNFPSFLPNTQESSDVVSANANNEVTNAWWLQPTSGISIEEDTVESDNHPSWDISTGILSHVSNNEPVSIKEEMEEIHLGNSAHAGEIVEQNHVELPSDNFHSFHPSTSTIVAYQNSTQVNENNVHSQSSFTFPKKRAIVSFSPQGYLLTSFPQIIPGFRVWNGREYVEDDSSVVVKPGALHFLPLINLVKDTEEKFFECIKCLDNDLILNIRPESLSMFCERMQSNCSRLSESLLWNLVKVLSCHSKEAEQHSLCVAVKSVLRAFQRDEVERNDKVASITPQCGRVESENSFSIRNLEALFSTSSKLEDILQNAVKTENWAVALILSRLTGSSLRERITRQFLYSLPREIPLIRFLVLLSNDIVLAPEDLDSVDWINAVNVLVDCENSFREKGLTAFGDYLLMHHRDVFASHCCYILAGIPIYADKIFSSRQWWKEKDFRMMLVGADPGSSIHASLTSIPSIVRTIFYVYSRDNQLSIWLNPFLLYMAYVLVENGRLVVAKHLCKSLVNKAHAFLKSNDPHLVSEAQRLTAVYYSYLEQLNDRLDRMLPNDGDEHGETGVSLTRSLSKVFRSIAKTGSKKSLRPRSSSNSSWESFAAAAVSIIAPAEENDVPSSMKPTRNSNSNNMPSETTNTENVPSASASPIPVKESAIYGKPNVQSHVTTTRPNLEPMNDTTSPVESPVKNSTHSKVGVNKQAMKVESPSAGLRPEERVTDSDTENMKNYGHSGAETTSNEKKPSARRSLSSFLMEKLTKIAGPKQANLGKENKFYYDEKLGRWVCEDEDENSEEVPPPPPSKLLDSSHTSHKADVKEPEEIQDNVHRAMSRRRWNARARYVDTFGQTDQISGTKPPLVIPPSVATRQVLKHSDPNDILQSGFSILTPVSNPDDFSDRNNAD